MTQTDQSEQNEEGLVEAVAGDEPALSLDDNPADLADPRDAAATPDPSTHVDTRQRILDVALDLFTEQGFDATSLRQIAERLGVTKAALYYYFESKDDILLALHMRIHEFGRSAFLSMGDEPVTLEQWGELVDEIAVPDAAPAQDLPHARAEPGRAREAAQRGSTTPSTRTSRTSCARCWPTPGSRWPTGSGWRRRWAWSSRGSSSPARPSTASPTRNWAASSAPIIHNVLFG